MTESKISFKKTKRHTPRAFPLLTAHGWKAVAVFAALLGFLSVKFYSVRTDPDESLRRAIHSELRDLYGSEFLDQMDRMLSVESADASEAADSLSTLDERIQITSISARGNTTLVTRVEVQVDGQPPPDGRQVRYFRVRRTPVNDWTILGETAWWSYYLTV